MSLAGTKTAKFEERKMSRSHILAGAGAFLGYLSCLNLRASYCEDSSQPCCKGRAALPEGPPPALLFHSCAVSQISSLSRMKVSSSPQPKLEIPVGTELLPTTIS